MAHFRFQYQPTSAVAEMSPTTPSEAELQALWFEHWMPATLQADDGSAVEIIQPGNWNHAAGPDFKQAAIRCDGGPLRVGAVELHLRAGDWDAHGHHTDPAYNETVLHVVWETPAKTYFPATENFRCVPQVILRDQLLAPWELLRSYLQPVLVAQPRPAVRAGRCQRKLSVGSVAEALDVVRAAGAFRLSRKAQRLQWRCDAVGLNQTLWEALAEGLGYAPNKIPFRLLAQRLSCAQLAKLPRDHRLALIFGLSGLLPGTTLEPFASDVREWIKPQWSHWWKVRTRYEHAILPRRDWHLAGLRPWNRPERRLAALAALVPLLSRLAESIAARDAGTFAAVLLGLHDPFWDCHTTFTANALPKAQHLLGTQRINDLLVNAFWPLVFQVDAAAAVRGWGEMESAPNSVSELARQRILGAMELKPYLSETLVQQGLLQIYQDYCLTDASACADCPFPEMIREE